MWYDIFQMRKLLQKDILRLQGKAEPWGVEEEGPSRSLLSCSETAGNGSVGLWEEVWLLATQAIKLILEAICPKGI